MNDKELIEELRDAAIDTIAGGTISVPGGYGVLHGDDAANIVDAIIQLVADALAAVPDAATELVDAIRWTVEYVGNDVLPALKGWSWFDALMEHAPEVAQSFVDNPIHFPKPTDAEAERDAALAAVERVRAVVKSIRFLAALPPFDEGNTVMNAAADDIVAALAGAPEPEVKP